MKIKEEHIPELIRQGKDREVIPLLYKNVFPLVKKYIVSHKGQAEDASDVFQDALMLFYKQVIKQEFKEHYKVYGYLFRISINRWINKLKKDKRVELVEEVEKEGYAEEDREDDVIYTSGNENILKSFFSNIGEKCIEVLTYTIYFNLLYEDIMLRMGLSSTDAVKMQQHRCKQKLIKELEKNPSLINKIKGL